MAKSHFKIRQEDWYTNNRLQFNPERKLATARAYELSKKGKTRFFY